MKFAVVVSWHNPKQRTSFLEAWGIAEADRNLWLFMQQDTTKAGCAATKNAGIRRALEAGAEYIVVIDDDCYPPRAIQQIAGPMKGLFAEGPESGYSLQKFAEEHIAALQPTKVRMIYPTTNPPSRGMPYKNHHIVLPVAAAMGFWNKNPDLDSLSTLVLGDSPEMAFAQVPIYRNYFPFSGMNFSFHREWAEEVVLIDVPRFDDIWMGFIWQKVAYEKGYCFNLRGPSVTHIRQSDVWKNFAAESRYLEINESLWSTIHNAPAGLSATELRDRLFGFLPAPVAPALDPGFGSDRTVVG